MPLREDILNPISESSPGGENLRYAPVFDKIKEARRQDDEGPMGDWQRERKVADWQLVIKLAGESIATKSKDLQLAVWLTEAMLHKEGFPGLISGVTLIRGLIENFWEGLYPELDDGDAEMRAAPLEWLGAHYLEVPIKRVPLTKSGLTLFDYQKAKKLGREADAAESYEKQEAFQAAVAAGELTLDEWDKAFASTSKELYRSRVADIDALLAALEELQPITEEKFGEFAPSFSKLRSILEEVRHQSNQLLQAKLEADPDEPSESSYEEEPEAAEPEIEAEAGQSIGYSGAAAAPAKAKPRPKGSVSAAPADREDAIERVASAARFWRTEDPYSPAPYLMLRGMRWGELRAGDSLDPSTFEAPTSETRTSLKRLLLEQSYAEAIEIAEAAMASPAGRAWLDLQRYVVTAAEALGYSAVAAAIRAELAALLKSYPDLMTSSLMDDTPCANNETVEWLKTFIEDPSAPAQAPMPVWEPRYEESEQAAETQDGTEKAPDAFELAMEAARSGRQQDAFEILIREAAHQNSGRGKFQRRLQLAQVCLSTGAEAIAFPILQELSATIDKHQLEEWESPDMVAHAFALLYRCMSNSEVPEEVKRALYSKICRLDPVQALAHSR
ncbi:MAG TPA: type VI secretion system protein TssA [Bryobacteraceae bacterium]|nr:type VI secretion system protein TssA [Bryobacteraceae bacterium]